MTSALICSTMPIFAQNLKPEFTARAKGIFGGGYDFTAGLRLTDNMTVGILGGKAMAYYDAGPGDVNALNMAAYMRRYIHFGNKDILALYGDLSAGISWVYQVNGKYNYNSGMEPELIVKENEGDILPLFTFEPGIRVRLIRNVHLFLGPTFSTHCKGIHVGFGF